MRGNIFKATRLSTILFILFSAGYVSGQQLTQSQAASPVPVGEMLVSSPVAGVAALNQMQTPPCTNKWFEVRPGSLGPGPMLTPGMHKIWIGKKDPRKGTIYDWTSFGPYQVNGGTKYLVILRGYSAISGLLPNDAAIAGYSNPGKNVASIYYQNSAADGLWYAICTQLVNAPPPPPPPPTDDDASEVEIFDNGNIGGVGNRPTQPTRFTISRPHVITTIVNYHWTNGRGAAPGTIALRGSDGRTYGPWPVTASAGQGGAPNVYWTCNPNVTLPAGTYTVVDSDPATWSQNSESGGQGFTLVKGYPVGASPVSQGAVVTALFENRSSESVHIIVAGETFGPSNRLAPGQKRHVQVSMPADGRIMFYAGRDGQVLATKAWDGDTDDLSRYPRVIFNSAGQLIVVTGLH